ncbi:host cell factor 1-like [Sipha flava]|jgi:host cell factor|uniref:Host cell factor 1 n=1 Tax=Sipha flava TaxID=143950 RepID=A0A2S2PX50_9HEMI|nr:host cell factor 1-like [Sipha flava]
MDKVMTENSAITATVESEVNNSVELDTEEGNKEPEVLVNQGDKKPVSTVKSEEPVAISVPNEEPLKVGEPEKLELAAEKSTEEVEKVNEPSHVEETPIAVSEPVQSVQPDTLVEQPPPTSDQLLSTADNLMESTVPTQESLIKPTQDQIVPVGQESLMEGGQQQVIPVTESVSNNDIVKLDDGVDLDQQSVLSMKDSELKDLVMRELSEFLTDEPSQNVGTSLLEIKSEYIKNVGETKMENLENNLNVKLESKEVKKSENDIADALSTLATAALNQAPGATNGTTDNVLSKPISQAVPIKQEGPAWCDVGVIKGTTCLVKQFYSTSITDEHENTSLDFLPDYTNKLKIDIQPGTAYKLRIAAINACGRGEWSEISAFKTCLPGYPGAPSAIKITKAPDGASLTWEAPPTSSGKILEYSVCLAIKNPKEALPQSSKPTSTNLNFVRVYCGPHNAAVVSHESLGAALIDRTNKPAIIFRIAAKNEKGYGPATQVRWLQDSNVPGSNKNPSMKREKSVNLLTGVPKRPKLL